MALLHRASLLGSLLVIIGLAAGMPLRDDIGNMSMAISTTVPDAQRYFNQGLRFMATFKFDYAVESQLEALRLDPNCAMCEWGLGLAYGQNINDALVMALEPDFLSNEPLAYEAVARAQTLLSAEGGGDVGDGHGEDIPTHARDTTLVSALSLKLVPTVKEYESHFVGGLPASLSLAYAEAMAEAVTQSKEKGWPDHAMVLVLAADAWMNVSPWDYWETPKIMRPTGKKARKLLEDSLALDPNNPWAIHLYIHLMEAGSEAKLAVPPAQRLQYLVPGAPHLQHMPSHVMFRTGQWHESSEANLRAVALPDSDASYPEHNMNMLMWSLGVEGRQAESNVIGRRLTASSTPRELSGVKTPLEPQERFMGQQALHMVAFADWEGIMALDPPPETADYPVAVHHFARSIAFVEAKDWDSYRREQGLISSSMERILGKSDFYGLFNAPTLTKIIDLLSRAEGLRGGICTPDEDTPDSSSADASAAEDGPAHRGLFANTPGLHGGTAPHARPDSMSRGLETMECPTAAGTASAAAAARHEEIDLLWQAVELEDSLGYDEPPPLPLPARLYLGAALLRGASDNEPASKQDVVEAEAVYREIETMYPSMARTLLGLWRAYSVLGKKKEAEEFHNRYVASSRYSEIVLGDSAHIRGQINVGQRVAYDGIDGGMSEVDPELSGHEGSASAAAAPAQPRSWINGWTGTMCVFGVIATLSLAFMTARSTMMRERWRRRYRGVDTGAEETRWGNRGQPDTAETDPLTA